MISRALGSTCSAIKASYIHLSLGVVIVLEPLPTVIIHLQGNASSRFVSCLITGFWMWGQTPASIVSFLVFPMELQVGRPVDLPICSLP